MARTKKVADSTESAPVVKPVKEIANPCEGCKYAPHDTKKQACKTCIRNKENG